jgi:hypothetical protein
MRPNASTLAGAKLCARSTAALITSCTVPCLELVGLASGAVGRFAGDLMPMSSLCPTRISSVVTGGGGPEVDMGCECAHHHRSDSTLGMHRHPSSLEEAGRGGKLSQLLGVGKKTPRSFWRDFPVMGKRAAGRKTRAVRRTTSTNRYERLPYLLHDP